MALERYITSQTAPRRGDGTGSLPKMQRIAEFQRRLKAVRDGD